MITHKILTTGITFTALTLTACVQTPAPTQPLRVGGLPLAQALNLPSGPGNERFPASKYVYVGNLPDGAASYDVRPPFERLDGGEIGAFLAAYISNKRVTGTATQTQTLLLMRFAATGGGKTGRDGEKIKIALWRIRDEIDVLGCYIMCK